MIDSVRTLETPEGVGLALAPAGLAPRFLAFALDLLIRGGAAFVVLLFGGILGAAGQGVFLMFWFLTEWWYPVLFEVLHDGSTPGKRILGLMVVHRDGSPLGWRASVLRNFLRTVDLLPFGYATGVVTMLVNSHSMRVGDLVAGSLVVYRVEARAKDTVPDVRALPPRVPLQLDEQRALIAFAERGSGLSAGRVQELAGVLHDLTGAQDDAAGAATLAGHAAWLVGRRP